VQGSNFTPLEHIAVTYEGKGKKMRKICATRADSGGSFSCKGKIPSGARAGKAGTHLVTAPGTTTGFDLT
jgi:hypothetical protein